MSTFKCEVVRVEVVPHPNPEAQFIELAKIKDYVSVIKKGQFKTGDRAVYIPESALLPSEILKKLGFWNTETGKGTLSGSDGNRIKAIKLKSQLSQGVLYPCIMDHHGEWQLNLNEKMKFIQEGEDVAEFLGITKYVPVIPAAFQGELWNAHGLTLGYDLENVKHYPGVIEEGEEVVMEEKCHGTQATIAFHPDINYPIIYSKGLGKTGLAFKINDANKNNMYVKTFLNSEWYREIFDYCIPDFGFISPVYIIGEIFGAGVQDLPYGQTSPVFRMFDVYLGHPKQGQYLNYDKKVGFAKYWDIPMVPTLYRGPFSKEKLIKFTSGKEQVSGRELHIREGVVVKPVVESTNPEIGRKVLKSVSPEYLLRKNKDATEFE